MPATSSATARCTPAGRVLRGAAALVGAALLLAGTAWGDDDHFPFGPFRMYSTSARPDGAVHSTGIEVRTRDGKWYPAHLNPWTVGMNRAEVEGQAGRFVERPELLGKLAEAHRRLSPRAEPWVGVRLVTRRQHLVDRRPAGVEEIVTAEWAAQ